MSNRIVIGMSGGVDSSAAAFLLKNRGYDVVGVTLRLNSDANADKSCREAKRISESIGIEHITVDMVDVFRKRVMEYFAHEYINGATPNPCVICNREIKFGAMLEVAHSLSAQKIATGHYAMLEENNGRALLKRSNSAKDQSYFLAMLTQNQLKSAFFPLGELEKSEIREIAEQAGLPCAQNPDSQEICFIPDNNYVRFIEEFAGYEPEPGNFVDTSGKIIGRHKGIIHYTVGQRKGLGAFGRPMFVTALDLKNNVVVLGVDGEQYKKELVAENMNWIAVDSPPNEFEAFVKIRSRAVPARARITVNGDSVLVSFDEPQRSVTPGQTAVIYDGDIVVGGGIIRAAP